MPISIRRATPQDAQAIVEIIAATFNEEANPAQIATLISEGEHLTFVAEDEKILGFIDGFYTIGNWDLRRLELDLLAVHPEDAGKGIGKALIRKFTESQENAAFIRALVAVDNIPMHHAMQNTSYQLQEQTMSLFIGDTGIAQKLPHQAQLIPVKTFTYTGIWLEGKINPAAIQSAQALRESLNFEVLGAVIPSDDYKLVEILQTSDFEFIKEFQWWQKG